MTITPSSVRRLTLAGCPPSDDDRTHVHTRDAGSGPAAPRRVVLYSHDTLGLGHVRRNLAIAGAFVHGEPRPDILLISGIPAARAFTLPPGVDCITLPGIAKATDGSYRSRSLSIPLEQLVDLRAQTIHAAVAAFQPDLLVVDKVPLGAFGELLPTLRTLAVHGRTRTVLGLRDVLDRPRQARREWAADDGTDAVERYYDAVWVYGDARVVDPVSEYGLPSSVADKLTFTGYLAPDPPAPGPSALGLDKPYALCLVGGGQDGAHLAETFVCADLPAHTAGVVVAGPYLPADARHRLHQLAAARADRHALDFVDEPLPLIAGASSVVAMGGYNTTVELLGLHKRTLLVPRVRPRGEQLVRAARLARLGVVDLLHPDRLSPPALSAWLGDGDRPRVESGGVLDLDGLARLPALASALVGNAETQGASRAVS
ncbi:MAG: glycosyltransferase family protein [Egibacteraceae bacterium]